MSGNTTAPPGSPVKVRLNRVDARVDARVCRTRDTLGAALVQLLEEKSFDDITVQQVLDRAGVSRTTFYSHYRDKQDLFLSDVEDFFEGVSTLLTRRNAAPQRIAPVQELFTHLADVRPFLASLAASGKMVDVKELGHGYFARSIEQRLVLAQIDLPAAELHATAHQLAGAMLSLMDWWISHERGLSPSEMDRMFHRLAWQGLGQELPG